MYNIPNLFQFPNNFDSGATPKLISGLMGKLPSATDKINNEVLNGAEQNKQQYENAQLLNGLARNTLVPEIIAAKELYENADNAKVQEAYGMDANQLKEYAHNNAELARRKALATGTDISPYGAGVTLQNALTNLDLNDYKALNQLMYGEYGKNSDDYYQDRYYHWRKQGYNDHDARTAAGGEASRYKANRMAAMMNGIETYGFNPNGALNQQAIQMIARALPDDDNGVLATFANAFATPKDDYNNENARQTAKSNFERQLQILDVGHQYDKENKILETQLNDYLASRGLDRDMIKLSATQKFQLAINDLNNRAKAESARQEAYNNSPQGKYKNAYDTIIMAGGTPEMAHAVAMTSVFPEYTKQINAQIKENNLTAKQQQEIITLFDGMYGAAEYFLSIDDKEKARTAISAIENAVTGEGAKDNSKWLDREATQYILKRVNLYNDVMNGKLTYKDAERQMFRETFKLDDLHQMLKNGQKQQALPIIEEDIKAITEGKTLHHRAHYDFNEAKLIQNELEKLNAVAKGEMSYDDALIALGMKKPQQQKTISNQDIPPGQIGHGYNVNPTKYTLGHGY